MYTLIYSYESQVKPKVKDSYFPKSTLFYLGQPFIQTLRVWFPSGSFSILTVLVYLYTK